MAGRLSELEQRLKEGAQIAQLVERSDRLWVATLDDGSEVTATVEDVDAAMALPELDA